MTVGAGDLHKAINIVWDASDLNAAFTDLWESVVTVSDFVVLNDLEGGPSQPFPFCVYEQLGLNVVSRSSGGTSALRQIHDIPWSFHVHARKRDGDSRTAKEIALTLAEEIMKVFGGHPTVTPTGLTLDNGNFLIASFQDDFGFRNGEDEWQWNVNYIFRVDVPVAV